MILYRMILYLLLIVAAASAEDCRRRRRRFHRLRHLPTFVDIPSSFAPLQQSRARSNCSLSRLFGVHSSAASSSEQYASNDDEAHFETIAPTTTKVSSSSTTDARIHDLISHPGVTWDIHTTFTSMHKKKLGCRHLHLFQRNNSNNSNNSNNIIDDDDGNRIYTDHLFDQFAQVVCHAGIVAKKEVFETWSSAVYIHATFFNRSNSNVDKKTNIFDDEMKILPIVNRVVDVAAGHGLLAWALLILDDEHQRNSGGFVVNYDDDEDNDDNDAVYPQLQSSPLTAFCIDVQMPKSAEIIHSCMMQQFPHLVSRFDYIEGRLEQLIPHPSCLLVSVHGCGVLSDILVATAAKHQVPLALVPCCHSRKRIVLDVASPFAKSLYDDIILNRNDNDSSRSSISMSDLADQLDEARIIALINSGHVTKEIFLPKLFTEKNRMILSIPSKSKHSLTEEISSSSVHLVHQPHEFVRRGQSTSSVVEGQQQVIIIEREKENGIILPKSQFLKDFSVPCKDNDDSRRIVNQLAGRIAANSRKEIMHYRYHTKHPEFHLSLWLPPEDNNNDDLDAVVGNDLLSLSEQSLSQIVESTNSNLTCTVTKVGPIYIHPTTDRQAQTFCVQYALSDDNNDTTTTRLLSFDDAKCMHDKLYASIPLIFPGSECR